jgi:hypothetical protein
MHGTTCIVWANLTPFSLQLRYFATRIEMDEPIGLPAANLDEAVKTMRVAEQTLHATAPDDALDAELQVGKTQSWSRIWANFRPLSLHSHRNAWAKVHLLGQPNTLLSCSSGG